VLACFVLLGSAGIATQAEAQNQPAAQALHGEFAIRRQNLTPQGFEPLARAMSVEGLTSAVYFATSRNPIPADNPASFGLDIGQRVYFGKATAISKNNEWSVGSIAVEQTQAVAALELARTAAAGGAPAGAASAMSASHAPAFAFAAEALRPQTDVLVFIHGATHDFNSAISTTASLKELYALPGREMVAMVFTYPTEGLATPQGYIEDRTRAGMSGMAMAAGFSRLIEFLAELRAKKPDGRVFLMAHSLGNYASRVAIQAISERATPLQKVFDAALLVAADEDYDTLSFDSKLHPLFKLSNSVTVYFAGNDKLLWLSEAANFRRPLGLGGPSDLDRADFGDALAAVDVGACSYTDADWAAHRYYLHAACVIQDIKSVLSNVPSASIPGRLQAGPRLFKISAQP
jgi:esterase/lipase superfamily enzyme